MATAERHVMADIQSQSAPPQAGAHGVLAAERTNPTPTTDELCQLIETQTGQYPEQGVEHDASVELPFQVHTLRGTIVNIIARTVRRFGDGARWEFSCSAKLERNGHYVSTIYPIVLYDSESYTINHVIAAVFQASH